VNLRSIPSAVHAWVYRRSGGAIAGRMFGAPVLLLITTGRKTGRQRTTPLMYLEDGNRIVIVASNAGADKHPTWYLNLRSNPNAVIELGRRSLPVVAEEPSSTETERLWPRLDQMYGGYASYRQRTRREIPLVILRPAPPAAPAKEKG